MLQEKLIPTAILESVMADNYQLILATDEDAPSVHREELLFN